MGDQQTPAAGHASPFESIRRTDEDGNEYWSARDLSKVLGYTEWRNFKSAIEKAQIACANSNQEISDHFVEANKLIESGKERVGRSKTFSSRVMPVT